MECVILVPQPGIEPMTTAKEVLSSTLDHQGTPSLMINYFIPVVDIGLKQTNFTSHSLIRVHIV